MGILNLDPPADPIQRIIYLDGVLTAAQRELNLELQAAYFQARIQGMFQEALNLELHSRKRALAWTRHENEACGRIVARWRDGF